ncbi:zinc finger MYM-type protein 1-like [Zingiber officinale]|uniref:zinc finger MYM-type protein 1-like n=1 Tax=Zingiber officinale TaxID=94328 RepID=UPI001C4B796F|nr:zinc finger MYM-type protein 1-like [Zingiber officinale]
MLNVTQFLLKQGLSFRGHDESSNSLNRGNFLELLQWYSQRNKEVSKVVNQNAPGNNQMISPAIQKDLTRACASEITLSIIEDIGNNVFSLMVDESRDISVKEQMRVVLRYVNKRGQVIERFLAIVHVSDTSSRSFKDAIDALFVKHGLSLSRLRGQGYDGASNMRGEFNGLKSLILQENPYARYIHCFSHQLQLVIIAVAKSNLNANKVNTFCELNEIPVPDMKDNCLIGGRSRRRRQAIANLHYYRVEIFYQKLVRLCDLYPEDFSTNDCIVIEQQLQNFIHNIRQDPNFSRIEDLGSFAQKIIETLKNQVYPLVYRLIEMTLVLPVATTSVEREFSTMKTDLRNRMGDEWMNDSLVVYIEKDIFSTIENEQIL